jgi:putative tricarboxylic transport membrane protein
LAGPLSAVPTWKENGVDAVVSNWRPIIGTRGWSAAQVTYWEDVFEKVTASDEWKAELDRSGGVAQFMRSRELAALFDRDYAAFRTILSDLGLAK